MRFFLALCATAALAQTRDVLAEQASRKSQEGPLEVWSKPLAGGAIAVGLF